MPGKNQHVVPTANHQWGVRGAGNQRLTHITDTQAEAIEIGKEIAKNQGSELLIHGRNGKIRSKDSYGHDDNPPHDQEH